ncbi:hypothetical protein [Paraburkholderia sp. 2C]
MGAGRGEPAVVDGRCHQRRRQLALVVDIVYCAFEARAALAQQADNGALSLRVADTASGDDGGPVHVERVIEIFDARVDDAFFQCGILFEQKIGFRSLVQLLVDRLGTDLADVLVPPRAQIEHELFPRVA